MVQPSPPRSIHGSSRTAKSSAPPPMLVVSSTRSGSTLPAEKHPSSHSTSSTSLSISITAPVPPDGADLVRAVHHARDGRAAERPARHIKRFIRGALQVERVDPAALTADDIIQEPVHARPGQALTEL